MDGELGALAGLARHFDAAMVGFDEGFDEAEAQTQAALGTALVAAIEAVPNLALFIGRKSHAGVAESDGDFAVVALRLDFHAATIGYVIGSATLSLCVFFRS
jgi:hypothetical protein